MMARNRRRSCEKHKRTAVIKVSASNSGEASIRKCTMCVCLVKAAGMLQGCQKQSADGQAQLDFSGKVKSCAKCVKKSLDLATISTQEALSFHFSFKTGYGSLGTRLGVTITLLSSAGFYYSNSVWERDHTKLKTHNLCLNFG